MPRGARRARLGLAPPAGHPVRHTGQCWYPRALPRFRRWYRNTFQVAVHERDSDRAFPHGGGDSFDRSVAHVTGGEHPGQARLKKQWRAAGGPAGTRVVQDVLTGEDETPLVSREVLAEPSGPWLRSDQDEQAVRRNTAPRQGLSVLKHKGLKMTGAGTAR